MCAFVLVPMAMVLGGVELLLLLLLGVDEALVGVELERAKCL